MQVEATYRAPNDKSFKVISESGSKLLLREVLMKLLQSEREAQEERNRKALEIGPANYSFELENVQHTPTGDLYVLAVEPRSKSKFVYNGKIWVDARDYAITRMEGSPATNPSFWVKNVEVQYEWAKIGGFWLPARNYSVTNVRLGGRAVLNIGYSDYQITASQAHAFRAKHPASFSPSPSVPGRDRHTSSSIGPSFSPFQAATKPTAVTPFCFASSAASATGSGSTKP